MNTTTYTLPEIIDPDSDIVTWTAFNTEDELPLPTFITTTSTGFNINPRLMSDVGTVNVTVRLDDTYWVRDYQFSIIVTYDPPVTKYTVANKAPYFQ